MTDEIELNDERADKLADLVQDRYQRAASARSSREVYRTQSVDFWLREAYERFLGKACNNRFNLTRRALAGTPRWFSPRWRPRARCLSCAT